MDKDEALKAFGAAIDLLALGVPFMVPQAEQDIWWSAMRALIEQRARKLQKSGNDANTYDLARAILDPPDRPHD